MKQKLESLKLFLGTRQGKTALVSVGLLGVTYYFLSNPVGQRQMRFARDRTQNAPARVAPNEEAVTDLVTRFNDELVQLRQQNEEATRRGQDLQKRLTQYEEKTATILKKMIDKMEDTEANGGGAAGQQPQPVGMGPSDAPPEEESEEIESFGLEDTEVGPEPTPTPQKVAFVGAGDSVRVKLLAGVNAPTDGTPYPVLLKLIGEVNGPDGSAIPLGEARVIAAAQGSLVDQRVLFRLTTMTYQLPSGEQKTIEIDGWVVGEDGIRGLAGVAVDPFGKIISGVALASAIGGAGQGLQQGGMNTMLNGMGMTTQTIENAGQVALGAGVARGGQEWSQMIQQRAKMYKPLVHVKSGREATAIFTKPFTITGLIEALGEVDNASVVGVLD
jgi:hypothetical protein